MAISGEQGDSTLVILGAWAADDLELVHHQAASARENVLQLALFRRVRASLSSRLTAANLSLQPSPAFAKETIDAAWVSSRILFQLL